MTDLHIEPIRAFSDNYIWLLHRDDADAAAVVDPGDARPVIQALKSKGLQLTYILITHHHADHTGGVRALCDEYDCQVFGPAAETIPNCDVRLKEGDHIELPALQLEFDVIELPGHTLGHIAFLDEERVFCGDTLFAGGCGRLFEGTPAQMWRSLSKLAALPADTRVYCAHEYTKANLQFALAVEPSNTALRQRMDRVAELRRQDKVTLPSQIGIERNTNPFLRCEQTSVIDAAKRKSEKPIFRPEEVFAVIRRWKDNF